MGGQKDKKSKVLIIGGGISGISSALLLSRMGVETYLVEKGHFVGGHSAQLACKATDQCLECNGCLVEDQLRELHDNGDFPIYIRSTIKEIKKEGEFFVAKISIAPEILVSEKCTGCGICYKECPEKGAALMRSPSHLIEPWFSIEPENCTCFGYGIDPICKKVCPEGAIDFEKVSSLVELKFNAMIIATGYEPFDPVNIERFNFNRIPNMITAMELERMIRFEGGPIRPSDNKAPCRIAFIQCVGSRNSIIKRDYCSRVCCGYGIRMAIRLAYDDPKKEIAIFYMDIQDHGKGFERLKTIAEAQGIEFIRSMPGEFFNLASGDVLVHYYDGSNRMIVSREFNMIILSVGISPQDSFSSLYKSIGILTDEDGFMKQDESLLKSGVALAGCVLGPMDVSESIASARRAVSEILSYLRIK